MGGCESVDILSLFGGMDTGRIALENKGYKINKSYYSEIKKPAIKLTLHHNPDTVNLGDINNWREWNIDYSKIFIVFSGSPCQDLSIAGNRAGLSGSKSSLFWVFVDILNHIKKVNPNVLFLQENVGSAPKLDVGIMSRALGVYPVSINSKLVVAALRDRYYWTNIKTKKTMFDIVTDIPQPRDRKIYFKDIIESGYVKKRKANAMLQVDTKNYVKDSDKQNILLQKRIKKGKQVPALVYIQNKEIRVKTNTIKGYDIMTDRDCLNLAFESSTTRRGRVTKDKAPCLLKGNEPLYCIDQEKVRLLNKQELCKLQGFPANHCDILTRNQAASLLGDGWTLPIIEWIVSFIKKAHVN